MALRWCLLVILITVGRLRSAKLALRARRLAHSALLLMMLAPIAELHASVGGRSGFSGNPSTNAGATCSVCHAPDGATPPAIGIVGPHNLNAGVTQNYYVVMVGGAHTAGIDISTKNGIGNLMPLDNDLYQLQGELTHTAPKNFNSDVVAFSFRYKAPNYNTSVTLYAAGNSTNGAQNLLGDAIATTAINITVRNGFEPPPDPPPPAVGEVSATLFARGLTKPVVIENAGDQRLFVVEQRGVIRIIQPNGVVLPTPFLDIETLVDDEFSEMGLLGLAFHPNYANNGYFYVYYTRDPGAGLDRSVVARFTVSSDPNVANPNSKQVLLEFEQPFSNHNGGDLHFDSSGYLYIASGDGGGGGDPQNNGQKTTTLLGKILRIDVNTPPATGKGPDCNAAAGTNYSIPPSNAFNDGVGGAGCDEIFVLGARIPGALRLIATRGPCGLLMSARTSMRRLTTCHLATAAASTSDGAAMKDRSRLISLIAIGFTCHRYTRIRTRTPAARLPAGGCIAVQKHPTCGANTFSAISANRVFAPSAVRPVISRIASSWTLARCHRCRRSAKTTSASCIPQN